MNREINNLKKEIKQICNKHYNVCKCDYCENSIAVDNYQCELFEPKEVERQYEVLEFEEMPDGKLGKVMNKKIVTKKEQISSDKTKDLYVFKCPVCGHIQKLSYEEFTKNTVGYAGTNEIEFVLDEQESNAAREFMQEHKDCCEKHLGKKWFSSTGGQFEYTICPTGLGNLISIKCKACKESKDITNIENW